MQSQLYTNYINYPLVTDTGVCNPV